MKKIELDYKKIVDEVASSHFIKRSIITIIGIFILAVTYNLFLLPNEIVTGGVSGIATILNSTLKISPSKVIMIGNIVFIIVSLIFLGTKKTSLSIIGSIIFPVFISITAKPCALIAPKIALSNQLLDVLVSACLIGVASGFIYKAGFSTGGTDVAVQVVNKYMHIPTGTSSLVINTLVIIAGAFVFGFENAIYAIIIVAINAMLVDKIMLGISDSKMFYIHTNKPDEVRTFINETQNGYTIMHTEGGYSKETNNIIMCVVPTLDYYMFKNVVTTIDPEAFLIISDCYEVYGGQRKERKLLS